MLPADAQGALTFVADVDEAPAAIEQRRLDLLLLDLEPRSAAPLALLDRLRADSRWRFLPIVALSGSLRAARFKVAAIEGY